MEADGARIDEAFRTLVHRAGPEQARGLKQGVEVVKQGSNRIQTSGENGQVGSNKWSKV